jgi:hypothetical protein
VLGFGEFAQFETMLDAVEALIDAAIYCIDIVDVRLRA